jgi:hypothetical protein
MKLFGNGAETIQEAVDLLYRHVPKFIPERTLGQDF